MSACGFCGHTPACGFAEIDGTRYCHGDCPHEDDGLPSCYEQAGSIHRAPPPGQAVTPCCERTPFELPVWDRMTSDPAAVTCEETP